MLLHTKKYYKCFACYGTWHLNKVLYLSKKKSNLNLTKFFSLILALGTKCAILTWLGTATIFKIHQILYLLRKLIVESYQVLHMPQKGTLGLYEFLCLSKKKWLHLSKCCSCHEKLYLPFAKYCACDEKRHSNFTIHHYTHMGAMLVS